MKKNEKEVTLKPKKQYYGFILKSTGNVASLMYTIKKYPNDPLQPKWIKELDDNITEILTTVEKLDDLNKFKP
jgi:1,2-phenylacetyl-CoA epoxidase catalytic subunit